MTTQPCIFCKIVSAEIPAEIVYKDEQVTAFRDINPAGPKHVLIIPHKHIGSINDVAPGDQSLLGHILLTARKVAEIDDLTVNGYRLIVNTGPHANQTVPHLHVHVIGGQPMQYPMG
jgi:histidine triad (HIT) family protein